jgi:hypothetical protein
MKQTKSSYFAVEAFHHNGKLVLLFLPEYLSDIRTKLEKEGIPYSGPTEALSLKFISPNEGHLELIMQQIELDFSDTACSWFRRQSWVPEQF